MPTTAYDIFKRFLREIGTDYDWSDYTEEEREQELLDILIAALPDYKFAPKSVEDFDELTMNFGGALDSSQIDLIVGYMVIIWKNSNFINIPELMKQALPSKDFNAFSQANHLDKLIFSRDSDRVEIEKQRSLLSYMDMDINDYLRKKS